jgi:hypothetical protein
MLVFCRTKLSVRVATGLLLSFAYVFYYLELVNSMLYWKQLHVSQRNYINRRVIFYHTESNVGGINQQCKM